MGVLMAFAVGYTVGAKGGDHGFEEIVASIRAIRASEEFAGLLGALRAHAGHALRELSDLLSDDAQPMGVQDVLARVRAMAGEAMPQEDGTNGHGQGSRYRDLIFR